MRRCWVLALVVVFAPAPALGCGACAMAAMDWVLPSTWPWAVCAVSWLLSSAALETLSRSRITGQPELVIAALITVLAFFMAAGSVGPVVMFPLAIFPGVAFVHAALHPAALRPAVRRALLCLGCLHLVAIGFAIRRTGQILQSRSDGEYIVQWGGTSAARARFKMLLAREPASLGEYRYIVANGEGFLIGEAAERIAVLGTYSEDHDLLESAERRLGPNHYAIPQLRAAVAKLKANTGA